MIGWTRTPRTMDVCCDVEIEQTPESFHAHAIPRAVELRAGDVVLVHGVPARLRFGERASLQCRATVTRARWLDRLWTRLVAPFELMELCEVGFAPKEAP